MIKSVINYITSKKLTPVRAIRAKCLDCSGGQVSEIKECTVYSCPLYTYRMGKKPTDKELQDYKKNLG